MQPDHRARYTFGFALLAALLAALILWNLNTGSAASVPGRGHGHPAHAHGRKRRHRMGDAPAAADRRHAARRCAVDFGLSAPDLFRQPHRRPVRARHLLGREADRFARDDRSALARPRDRLDRHDPRRLLRRDAVDGFRPRARAARAPDVPAHHRRCDGRLHLLGGHGFRRDLRRGQQHRQPAQLVAGQLFRHFVGTISAS